MCAIAKSIYIVSEVVVEDTELEDSRPDYDTPVDSIGGSGGGEDYEIVDIRLALISTFRSQLGVVETAPNSSPEIDQYLAAAGLPPGHHWCAAFAGWGYLQHDLPVPNGFAWSPSWFPASKRINHKDALIGDVGGIFYSNLGRIGHIVVYDENWTDANNIIVTIEGNTSGEGSRTGDRVARKRRSKNQIRHSANWID